MRIKGVSPLIATIILIALTVSIGAIIVGWGRSYIQRQTSCLGISLLIQSVVYDTNTGKYNITVLNNGEQQVIVGRLKVGFVDANGYTQSTNPTITDLQGNQIPSDNAILPGEKILLIAGVPSSISNPAYVYIHHQVCGKVSNDYLLG